LLIFFGRCLRPGCLLYLRKKAQDAASILNAAHVKNQPFSFFIKSQIKEKKLQTADAFCF